MSQQLDSGIMLFMGIIFMLCSLKPSTTLALMAETSTAVGTSTDMAVDDADATLAPLLPMSAEKLVRYRRHPPVTIVKHVIRSSKHSKPRRRYKRPKIKYGQPSHGYSYNEPIPYYKENHQHSSVDTSDESHDFPINQFHQFNVDAADFDLPASSYETQTMDLDFYSNGDTSYHTAPKVHNIEYSFDTEQESPSYSYIPQSSSNAEADEPRVPHQKYGAPNDYGYSSNGFSPHSYSTYSTSEQKYHAPADDHSSYSIAPMHHGNSYGAHPPDSYQAVQPVYTPDLQYHPPYSEPALPSSVHKDSTQYGATGENPSDSYAPPNVQNDYHPSSSGNYESVPSYEQANTNSAYGSSSGHHNFAEPPLNRPEIEITYSPSYEINLPSSKIAHNFNSYEAPTGSAHSQSQNFAEPPTHSAAQPPLPPPPPQYSAPDYKDISANSYHPQPSSIEDYLPPPSKELPLNSHHQQPAYNFPKSSYEVPIYDPIPFDSSNKEEQEYYPPHPYDNSPTDHSMQQPHHPVLNQPTDSPNHQDLDFHRPTTDFTMDTFEQDAHTSGSSTASVKGYSPRPRRTRKRKRVRGSMTTTSTKHILDVPELEEAYQAESHYKYHDTDADASTHVKERPTFHHNVIAPTPDSHQYVSNAWNPMRIRTSVGVASTPATATTIALERPTAYSPSTRKRYSFKPRSTKSSPAQPNPDNFTISPKLAPSTVSDGDSSDTVAVLSIEKSRSQSYYDGTVAPPTVAATNLYSSRFNKVKSFTRTLATPIADKEPSGPSRTTKSVFETTYFKHPNNDKEGEHRLSLLVQNLPKNHKAY